MTRERIACGAVGVATPSTRRASTLCHVCHRGHMCRGWGSRGHTLRGETSTTPVTHRCVRCGERDVHGVRHERARTWNVERWATTPLRDPAATRTIHDPESVTDGETADTHRKVGVKLRVTLSQFTYVKVKVSAGTAQRCRGAARARSCGRRTTTSSPTSKPPHRPRMPLRRRALPLPSMRRCTCHARTAGDVCGIGGTESSHDKARADVT